MSLVSVVIAVYNGQNVIQDAIRSVQNQSYQNLEIIVVDDGSLDKTYSVVQLMANEDTRIKLIKQKNSGVSAARNKGIENASGKYICFLDADDTYSKEYIAQMVNCMTEYECQLVICGYIEGKKEWKYNKLGRFSGQKICEEIFLLGENHRIFNPCWNKIFLLDIIRQYDVRFPVGMEMGEDEEFVLRYMVNISDFFVLDQALYNYSISDSSITSKQFKIKWAFDQEKIYSIWQSYFKQHEMNCSKLNRYIVKECFLVSVRIMSSNSIKEAGKACKEIFDSSRMKDAANALYGTKEDFLVAKLVKKNQKTEYLVLCFAMGIIRKMKRKILRG